MKYEVIGKISDKHVKEIFQSENLEETISKRFEGKIPKGVVKTIVTGALIIVLASAFGDVSFAQSLEYTQQASRYGLPKELNPIFEFIDWLIWMCRLIVSSVIGLIATYAGYKWSTDLSANGVSEAKKILKQCAVGVFWVQFGATIANYFIDKLQSLVMM